MKRTIGLIVSILILAASPALAEGPHSGLELAGFGTIYLPQDDAAYDVGAGLELQVRCWLTPNVGLAAAIGDEAYAINERDEEIQEQDRRFRGELEGSVALAPVGVSLLVRPIVTERMSLTLAGGVRYVFVESDAELEVDVTRPGSRIFVRDTLDIDDGVVAVATASLEVSIAKQVALFGGAGYQFDLEKGDVEFLDEKLGENELEAFMLQAGLLIRF